jgi:HK97 family phage portal protein
MTLSDIGIAFKRAKERAEGTDNPTGLPAVYRANQILTDTVASLHMEEVIGKVANPETPPLLSAPNPAEMYHTTMSKVMASLLFRGNAYLWPRTRNKAGIIQSCYVLNPDEVSVTPDAQDLYPVYRWRGLLMEPDAEIVHIPLNNWPGNYTGVSPITAARWMMEGATAEADLAARIMKDDGTPGSGVIKVPDKLTNTEAEEILNIWMETHGESKRPGVLGGGASWDSLSFSPVDAQWIEQRQFTIQDIARLYGMHGFFLLVDSGSSLTYSTTESLFRLFLTMTLNPTYLERIEQGFSRMMPAGRKARFNVDQILRADIETRFRAYAIGIKHRFLTPNEAREQEGWAALPGGDEFPDMGNEPDSTSDPLALPSPAMNGANPL